MAYEEPIAEVKKFISALQKEEIMFMAFVMIRNPKRVEEIDLDMGVITNGTVGFVPLKLLSGITKVMDETKTDIIMRYGKKKQ